MPMERNGTQQSIKSSKSHTLRRSLAVVGDDDGVSSSSQPQQQQQSKSQSTTKEKDESADTENLLAFIKETLNKHIKDRNLILRTESELLQFINTQSKSLPLPGPYSSYQRLLIHRVAAYFGLEHNIDNSGSGILITRGDNPPLPEGNRVKFRDLITTNLSQEQSDSKQQKQRKTNHSRSSAPPHWANQPRILKVASFEATTTCEGRTGPPPHVAKAYSFGGYARHNIKTPNTLSLETSLSPASSGYKSTSFPSMELRTPSPAGPYFPNTTEEAQVTTTTQQQQPLDPSPTLIRQPLQNSSQQQELVLWAVSDIKSVPPGAILIDPSTLSPLRYNNGQEEANCYHPNGSQPQPSFSGPTPSFYQPPPQNYPINYNYYEHQVPDLGAWFGGLSINSQQIQHHPPPPPPSYPQQYYSTPHSNEPQLYFPQHQIPFYSTPRPHPNQLTGTPLRFIYPQHQHPTPTAYTPLLLQTNPYPNTTYEYNSVPGQRIMNPSQETRSLGQGNRQRQRHN